MHTLITVVHVIACIFMIMVVLLQSGRGGGMGAAFAGASGQIFGGRGASSFLSRATSVAAIVFFLTSLTLSVLDSRHASVVMGMQPKPAKEGATDPNGKAKADKTESNQDGDDKGKTGTDAAPSGKGEADNIERAAPGDTAPGDAEKPWQARSGACRRARQNHPLNCLCLTASSRFARSALLCGVPRLPNDQDSTYALDLTGWVGDFRARTSWRMPRPYARGIHARFSASAAN